MSGDRFEIELREVLREEARQAPVVLGLAELKARAGTRSRWAGFARASRLAFGGAVTLAGVIALVVLVNPNRSNEHVAGSPSPSPSGSAVAVVPSTGPSSSNPSPAATPSPTATPTATPVVLDLGGSGSMVVARLSDTGHLTLVSVAPDKTERAVTDPISIQYAVGTYFWDNGRIWLGPDGQLIVEEQSETDQGTTYINVLFDLTRPASVARALPEGSLIFLSGGRFAITSDRSVPQTTTLFDSDHPDGTRIAVPDRVELIGATADGSAFVATQAPADVGDVTAVIVDVDGALHPWDSSAAAASGTGERRFGANGETLSAWADDGASGSSSGLNVVPHGGGEGVVNISPTTGGVGDSTWTSDGRSVVMLAEQAIYRWDGTRTTKVRDLTATLKRQSGLQIVGLSDSGVFLSNESQGVTFLPFDTSPSRGTDGLLLAVVP